MAASRATFCPRNHSLTFLTHRKWESDNWLLIINSTCTAILLCVLEMHERGQSLPEGFQKELVLDVSHFSPQTLRCGQVDPEREGRAEVSASFLENVPVRPRGLEA